MPGLERSVTTLREQVAEMDSLKERNRSLTKKVADFEQLVACEMRTTEMFVFR